MVVLQQPRRDQPFSGRVLGGAAESGAGAVLLRAGERAVQHRGSGEVERVAVVAQAAGDLAVVEEPWSWSKRVAVVSEPCQDLAGVREDCFESLRRADGSVERPSQSGREGLRGAVYDVAFTALGEPIFPSSTSGSRFPGRSATALRSSLWAWHVRRGATGGGRDHRVRIGRDCAKRLARGVSATGATQTRLESRLRAQPRRWWILAEAPTPRGVQAARPDRGWPQRLRIVRRARGLVR